MGQAGIFSFFKKYFLFFFISPVCAELPVFLSSRLVPCPRARDLCGIREEPPCPSIIYSTNGFVLLLVYSPISSAVNTGRRKKKSRKGKKKIKKKGLEAMRNSRNKFPKEGGKCLGMWKGWEVEGIKSFNLRRV